MPSCYSMAVSNELSKAGFVPTRVDVVVEIDADRAEKGWTVQRSRIRFGLPSRASTRRRSRGRRTSRRTAARFSGAIAGNVELELDATLVC